ncbi:hypothetical protein [Desulfotignum phosphitoxidans]|uniref:HPr kinase n=1 Tax=Desulfotignum phosphitoxidans DSM 13687 TaxID=1286635 RepID=S0G237_9BACT|nr:hypothetical protein [Desulfotignum phosphitoxidans]EMS79544.1 hypothetical protein Dpo_4c00910 [Desulfotignum phosphitoxidans DSM 13687]
MTARVVLNFHDLIIVSGQDLPGVLKNKIQAGAGRFVSKALPSPGPPPEPDILLTPMTRAPELDTFSRHMNHVYGFCQVMFEGKPAICFLGRARPELCVYFSSPGTLVMAFQPGTKSADLFWAILLFACHLMSRLKQMLLCHGSVVVKNGRAIVFSGHHGVGKTPVLLHFLKNGWEYLSDDKFFLSRRQVYLMQTHIAVNHYHFQMLPWLSRYVAPKKQVVLPQAVRQGLSRLATRIWPGGVPVRVYCQLHPGTRIDLETNPFHTGIVSRAVPVLWVMLQNTGTPDVQPLNPETGLDKLALIQQMFFTLRFDLEKCLLFYSDRTLLPVRDLLAQNLPEDLIFALASVPENTQLDRFYENILDACP